MKIRFRIQISYLSRLKTSSIAKDLSDPLKRKEKERMPTRWLMDRLNFLLMWFELTMSLYVRAKTRSHSLVVSLNSVRSFKTFSLSLSSDPGQNTMSASGEGINSKKFECSPFVAVSFQDHFTTTNVSDGPQPNWNEELKLPFTSPGDYSPSTLQTVNDTVFIHLFDRLVPQLNIFYLI